MRGTSRLILLLILLIAASVGYIYNKQKTSLAHDAPAIPAALPNGISAKAQGWSWSKDDGNRTVVRVFAKDFQQLSEGTSYELEGVELRLFHKDGDAYDLVRSAKAQFNTADGILYSDGDVEITKGVPVGEQQKPTGKLLVIKSSGVRYDTKNGKAVTQRPAEFTFDRGEGKATGAEYDPDTRELRMFKDVQLVWHPQDPKKGKTMQVESGTLTYKEKESKVFLSPWSRLKRDTMTLDAADSTISLNEGVIQQVDAQKAHGIDLDPKRKLDYAADQLRMNFDEDGVVKTITGENNARLLSTSDTGNTTITSNRVDMEFDTSTDNSTLKKAIANGKSVVESRPIVKPNVPQPETRILRSEVIQVNMKPGGQEIQTVETHTPGALEFLPNSPGQKHRFLDGERFWITYGVQNQIQNFRSINVVTRTEPEQVKGKPPLPPAITTSKDLNADFEPKGGTLRKLEQWNDFRYEEGQRKARADKAVLEYAGNQITLTGPASRVWDPTGSTSADKIVLNQKSGDFEAVGNVTSTRVPEKKKDAATGMLSGDDPMQAKADRMTSTENNLQIRYEGNALLWQGPNRIQAERIFIDRDNERLEAHGKVVSQFLDKSGAEKTPEPKVNAKVAAKVAPKIVAVNEPDAKTPKKNPVFTIVKAPDMTYDDSEHVAHYTNGVSLNRPGLDVQSRELRAYMKKDSGPDPNSGSSLEKAIADGAVKILQTSPGRKRTGTSEHAEYFVDESKVILQQGQPQLVDSVRGTTRGKQLTWFSNSDRLLVDGAASEPAVSNIHRK
jgi:lipopolysaccharide export system protein LptA